MDGQQINLNEITIWLAAILALLVSLLALYNAAKLKTGVLAVATYLAGAGMLSIAGGFLFLAAPDWRQTELGSIIHNLCFIFGFILLGLSSYKIYTMSKI